MNKSKAPISIRPLELNELHHVIDYLYAADESYLSSLAVDINKLPAKDIWLTHLQDNYHKPLREKESIYIGWLYNNELIGHSCVTDLSYGKQANIHLHIWNQELRRKKLGSAFLIESIAYYFEIFQLQKIICEPRTTNNAPNKILLKLGFRFIKAHRITAHFICFETEMSRYEITRDEFYSMYG